MASPLRPRARTALATTALLAAAFLPAAPASAAPPARSPALPTSATSPPLPASAQPATPATSPVTVSAPAAPVSLDRAHWIWSGPATAAGATGSLRRTFTAPAGPWTDTQLVVAGDDAVDVWLNGTWLAGSPRRAGSWKQAQYVDLAAALKPGANTLTVAVRNTTAGSAGLLGRIRVAGETSTTDLVTDGAWEASAAPAQAAAAAAPAQGAAAPAQAAASPAQGAATPAQGAADPQQTWTAARDLGRYGVAPWRRGVTAPRLSGASPVHVEGLTVDRRTNPVGVDPAAPRFGWRLGSAVKGQLQGRYQVVVGTRAGAADVWNSGIVASGTSTGIAYDGPAPASNRTYHWRVRVWDTQGRPSAWSKPARFDTGLADPAAEWPAAFIGGPAGADLTGASWIWYPEGDPASDAPAAQRFFRRTAELIAGGTATLVVTGDDTADVWVNGVPVSSSRRVADSWKRATTIDVTAQIRAGTNTIAVAATNTSAGPAGFVLKLAAGSTVVSDGSWKAAQTVPDGWQQPGFDDSAWPAARVAAAYGGGQWGNQVTVSDPAPYLGTTFAVAKPVARARLFTTALGLHDTYLNGAKVGPERLAPGWTDYTKRLQYRVHDVTGSLKRGENKLGALLGNGWYSGNIGFAGSERYGTSPWYSAFLTVEYADGTRADIRTDGSWSASYSSIVSDDLYHGEDQDARITGDRSQPVRVRTGALPPLVAQVDPGVTVQQELRPVSITEPKPGVWIADLGQNFAGWNRLTATGPAGTRITVRHAEILNADGTLYTANLRAAQATDTFTLAGTGGPEVFEPHFTVHGYRYVELTGFPGTPTAQSLTGLAAWSDGAETGTFTTSDPLINQVQHNILWGARSNMLSIPTDCPQRDERLGWTGDIASFGATSTFNFDAHALLTKFTDDLVDAQRADGAFTDVAPAVIDGAGKAGWGDAGVIVPYTIWQRYGDLEPADKHFDALAKWVDYLRSTAGADLIRDHETFGDWLNVDDPTANDLTSTAFFGWSARLVSRLAAATGRPEQAASYGELADRIAAAFAARFVAADGTVSGNSQTGYVLALAFGLVPADRVQAVADRLADKVVSRDGHLSVGFMGVENLLPVLADHGHADTAYEILQQPGYPGWGYMSSRGATTIWERWDGIRPDGSLQDPGMNSFNHYGLGSVGDWLYRSVGGLGPDAPGYRTILIAPQPGGTLTSARTSLVTAYGPASSSWSRSGGRLTLTITIPTGTTATVRVPAGPGAAVSAPPEAVPQGHSDGAAVFSVPSGSYAFTVN